MALVNMTETQNRENYCFLRNRCGLVWLLLLVMSISAFAVEVDPGTRMQKLEKMRSDMRRCQTGMYKGRDTVLTLQQVEITNPELLELLETTILPLARELDYNPNASMIIARCKENNSVWINLIFCQMDVEESDKYAWVDGDIAVFFRDLTDNNAFKKTKQRVRIKHQIMAYGDWLTTCDAELWWKCELNGDRIESIELMGMRKLNELYPEWMLTLPRMRRELVRSCISPPMCEIPAPSPEPIKPEISI